MRTVRWQTLPHRDNHATWRLQCGFWMARLHPLLTNISLHGREYIYFGLRAHSPAPDAFCNMFLSRISDAAKCLQCEGCKHCRTCSYSCKGCMCLKAIFLKIHSESSKPEFVFFGVEIARLHTKYPSKAAEIVKLIITAAAFVLSEHSKGAEHVWNIAASKPL